MMTLTTANGQKATDAQILAAFSEHGSAVKAGIALGMCGQSVHERLVKLGANKPPNFFGPEDLDFLKAHYEAYAATGKLSELAAKMGRTRPFLCRQARGIGLTDAKRPKSFLAVWKYMPLDAAELIWEDFKASSLGLGAYCKKKGFDDLGFSRRMRELFADEYEAVIELKTPKQTKYRIGRAFEYRVRDLLRTKGYFVMRSPQSKSPTDLVAIMTGCVLFVQCKRGGSIGVQEWNELFDLARSAGAKPILAVMAKSGRGITLHEMVDRKSPATRRPQPMVSFDV